MAVDEEVARPPSRPGPAPVTARVIALAIAYRELIDRLVERRPFVALFAAGALSVLAMAPFHLWPVLFFTLPALFWSLESAAEELRALLDSAVDLCLAGESAELTCWTAPWISALLASRLCECSMISMCFSIKQNSSRLFRSLHIGLKF